MNETGTCIYCDAEMPIGMAEYVPDPNDRDEWRKIADYYRAGCEWVETRAHRRPLPQEKNP